MTRPRLYKAAAGILALTALCLSDAPNPGPGIWPAVLCLVAVIGCGVMLWAAGELE